MVIQIHDPDLEAEILEDRRSRGIDRWDEVWNGIYVIYPPKDDEHQDLQGGLTSTFLLAMGWGRLGDVRSGVNVTDQQDDWTQNYRCPDVVVYRKDTEAENRSDYWLGGPDFCVEIISENDLARDKLDFYAKVGTSELLLVDRDPWALELYRLIGGSKLRLVGKSTLAKPDRLVSEVIPLTFHLHPGPGRPTIDVRQNDGQQCWTV
jgi:Uma2 family endonuclease